MQQMLKALVILQRRPWIVTVFGGVVMLWLAHSVFLSDHGLQAYQKEKKGMQLLQLEAKHAQANREDLARRILLLRDNRAYQEEVVRHELGFVYPNEYMIIMNEGSSSADSPQKDVYQTP